MQINRFRNKKGDTTTEKVEIEKIILHKSLYSTQFENLDEIKTDTKYQI